MLFNSYVFIFFFLPVTLAGYFCFNRFLPARRFMAGKIWLVGMSLWFYAYFNLSYLFIIVLSMLFNYAVGRAIARGGGKRARQAALAIGVAANLGVLFVFKYYDFFAANINAVLGTGITLRHILIPLGISFFTFQQIGYLVDLYRKEVSPATLLDYALFVCFFPQLIAGPIVSNREMIPQFEDSATKRFNTENFSKGLYAFAFGMAKKMLLADTLGAGANWGWANLGGLDATGGILTMLCYTLQIYFDFSGYCDMATGLGLMFNIDIVQNFNSPYKAIDILDFWKRWHITLTRFFTGYLYIPLGGSRKGTLRTYANVMAVFLVSGLWHGASWNFVLWGAMHGVASVLNRIFKTPLDKVPKAIRWATTFLFVNVSWLFFRAPNLSSAADAVKRVFSFRFGPVPQGLSDALMLPELAALSGGLWAGAPFLLPILLIGFGLFAATRMQNTNQRLAAFAPTAGRTLSASVLLVCSILSLSGVSIFLYFNF